jgi:hypothetical protein
MIQPIKDNRHKNAEKKKFTPKPCWVEAFMILLLHKNGGSLTVSLATLKRFEALEGDNKTKLTFDKVKGTVTITAPEAVMPGGKIQYNKRLIT